jgi:hypothetical protein
MRKNYFFVASTLLLILSLIAFSDNLITDVGQESNSDPKFIIHGLFCLAWFIILVIQTNYIKKGDYKSHIKLGVAGMTAAIGVFATTVYIFVVIYKGWDAMPYYVKANRFFMPSFALMVWLGYINRKKPDIHKRLMYVGTLYMLLPILDRVNFFMDALTFDAIVWNSFWISLLIYDWITLRKIHRISWIGYVWFYIIWAISILT